MWSLVRLLLFVAMCLPSAFAHKVGNSAWCLMVTQFHWECKFETASACNDALASYFAFAAPGEKNDKPVVEGEKANLVCNPNPSKMDYKGF